MSDLKSSDAKDWREGRRLRAWELYEAGWRQKDMAEALGVTEGAVSQWVKRGIEGGPEALATRKPPGAPRLLSEEQEEELRLLLWAGAGAWGFEGDRWTAARIGEVIRREFGIEVCVPTVCRTMGRIGWSPQKPDVKAAERNEEAIREWKEKKWPEIKKKPRRRAA